MSLKGCRIRQEMLFQFEFLLCFIVVFGIHVQANFVDETIEFTEKKTNIREGERKTKSDEKR